MFERGKKEGAGGEGEGGRKEGAGGEGERRRRRVGNEKRNQDHSNIC